MLIKAIITIGLFIFNKINEKICVNDYYFFRNFREICAIV